MAAPQEGTVTPKEGSWCHVEIMGADPQTTGEFYRSIFGWQIQHIPEMDYTIYTTGEGGIGGGIMKKPDEMPQQMLNYINVSEIEPYLEKIQSAGGTIIKPIAEIPGIGWFAVVADPDQNMFALWKQNPAAHQG